MEIKQLNNLVKEKYDKSTSKEKMYMNSYLAAVSSLVLLPLNIGFLLFSSLGLILYTFSYFFIGTIYFYPINLLSLIFMLFGIICMVSYIKGRKRILIKLLKFKI